MANLKPLIWKGIFLLVLGVLIVCWGLSQSSRRSPPEAKKKGQPEKTPNPAASSGLLQLVGTATCSARGCHGATEPVEHPDKCQQNEYIHRGRDRHAGAYSILLGDRAKKIAKLLGRLAHEDPRCLACHTNPVVAILPTESSFAKQEKQFGVGCESCHSNADNWLIAHTASGWRKRKESFKMPDQSDLAVQAKTCAGCHIGAPPKDGLPLREVNHDLIAAGHPRLNFEFGTYRANMPAHWRLQEKTEAHLWAVGQTASAQAAIEVLIHRADSAQAKSAPWPEFAEYDCFACHHFLAQPSWRQQVGYRGRKPGALPWGSWYFALSHQLAGDSPSSTVLRGALHDLEKTMQEPFPNPKEAAAQAKKTLAELEKLANALAQGKDEVLARKRIVDLTKNHRTSIFRSWDGAEQVFLALHALNASDADPHVSKLLNKLTQIRAFPRDFNNRLRAALVGWHASWWMGEYVGPPVLLIGLLVPGWKLYLSRTLIAMGLMVATTLCIGLAALAYSVCADADAGAFEHTGHMHDFSYLGGFLAILTGSAYMLYQGVACQCRLTVKATETTQTTIR